MQNFTLIHDGTIEGWRTTYLAFHVAARFGAPLKVLVLDSGSNQESPAERAKQVEIGGHAAGLAIETAILPEYSVDIVIDNAPIMNGLFIPRRLIKDENAMAHLLQGLDCPLWIVSEEYEARRIVALIDDPAEDHDLIEYANTLSQRIGQTLTLLMAGEKQPQLSNDESLSWKTLGEVTPAGLTSALDQLQTVLLILKASNYFLVEGISCNFIIYNPESRRA
jgi:hypothetical protein